MKNNFILQLVTKETGEQAAFQKMLVQENVSFRLLCNGSYNESETAYYQIEAIYVLTADRLKIAALKKTIDCAIKYETLLLYEFMNW